MVQKIEKKNQTLYRCEECGFHYEDAETARRCEAWCHEKKSCNVEIIKEAVENRREQ